MKARFVRFMGSVAIVLAVASGASALDGLKLEEGDTAPDFALQEFGSNKKVTLKEFTAAKKVVMLEFWATWCDICKVEMPRLQKEYEKYKDKGYQLLAITLSRGDQKDKDKIKSLREKNKVTYPILLDTEYEVATKLYGLSGPIPLKVIVDCEGKVRYSHVGDFADGVSEVPIVVDELLAEPACKR